MLPGISYCLCKVKKTSVVGGDRTVIDTIYVEVVVGAAGEVVKNKAETVGSGLVDVEIKQQHITTCTGGVAMDILHIKYAVCCKIWKKPCSVELCKTWCGRWRCINELTEIDGGVGGEVDLMAVVVSDRDNVGINIFQCLYGG